MSNRDIEELFYYAMIAEASYVSPLTFSNVKNDLVDNGWPEDKATIFADNFNVVADTHQPNMFPSGFSATLFFKDDGSGKHILGLRGTDGLADTLDADMDLVFSGVAQRQSVDLYNYVKKLTTSSGQKYLKANYSPWNISFEESDDVGMGLLSNIQSANVAGHSLGGGLTASYGRLFESYYTGNFSYTYNGAGVAGDGAAFFQQSDVSLLLNSADEFFQEIGGAASYPQGDDDYTNVYAQDSLNVVTNDVTFKQLGYRVGVNIEGSLLQAPDHSSTKLTDSLGVAWIFNKLDSTYNLTDHSLLMDAANRTESGSLDKLVNGLYKIQYQQGMSDRWSAIRQLNNLNLSGVNINVIATDSISEILTKYNTSDTWKKSVIHSAYEGLPFLYIGGNSGAFAQYNPDEFSPKAALDLASMLAVQMDINSSTFNAGIGSVIGLGDVVYTKPDGSSVANSEGLVSSWNTVKFLNSDNNTEAGNSEQNSLYGFSGDDTLSGGGGDDHLEGGSGDDTLNGGDDDDTLFGGEDADTLNGEKGNDVLDGGEGDDTYLFYKDSGANTIFNYYDDRSDTDGVIKFEDEVVDGSNAIRKSDSSNIYYDKDNEIRYILDNRKLIIQFEDQGAISTSVTIPDFDNGNLGINLPTEIDEMEDTTSLTASISAFTYVPGPNVSPDCRLPVETINGGYDHMPPLYKSYKILQGNPSCYTEAVTVGQTVTNDTQFPGKIYMGPGDDRVFGADVSEFIHGSGGEDYIKAGGGDDLVNGERTLLGSAIFLTGDQGEEGIDWIEGGDGDDVLVGGAIFQSGYEPTIGTPPYYEHGDEDFQNSQMDYSPDTQNDTIMGDAGADTIYGNLGDDTLSGGEGDDQIYGGAHNDKIEGGDGNDSIFGDADILIWLNIDNEFAPHHDEAKDAAGDDFISGGEGDDSIFAGAGNDDVEGGPGADTIYGDGTLNEETNEIDHEDNAAYNGNDNLSGGDGADTIWGFGGDDIIHGDEGDDEILGDHEEISESAHGNDLIRGGAGNDTVDGQAGDDQIYGDGGEDLLLGGKGYDRIFGGDGADELQGGEHDDYLKGEEDADRLFGDEGNDFLIGDSGEDELVGGDGSDVLSGGADADQLWGGDGDDRLNGGSGNDILQGDAGNDILSGGPGTDTLRGNAGNDTYLANIGYGSTAIEDNSGSNSIVFGAGVSQDSISVEQGSNGVFIDYGTGDYVFVENSGVGSFSNITFADGTSASLTQLLADFSPENTEATEFTLGENVSMEDLDFSRTDNSLVITYQPGSSLGVQSAIRSMLSSSESSETSDEWIDLEALEEAGYVFTTQTVVIDGVEYEQVVLTNWYNAEHDNYLNSIVTADGTIDLTQLTDLNSDFSGSDFTDAVQATEGNDVIDSGAGNDTVDAGSGADIITAGAGNDQIIGGLGDDVYHFGLDDGHDVILDEGGNDSIKFGEGISSSQLKVEEKIGGLYVSIIDTDTDTDTETETETENSLASLFVVGWFENEKYKIENFEFADGSVLTASAIEALIEGNRSPVPNLEIDDQVADLGREFSLALPSDLFIDPDEGDEVSVSIIQADGSALPDWLSYDSESQVLSGTPGNDDTTPLELFAIGMDNANLSARVSFNLSVNTENAYIEGTSGDDILDGGIADELIVALEGNDVINAGNGHDEINGGPGDDVLNGDLGNDIYRFNLGDGVDTISNPSNHNALFGQFDTIQFGEGILPENVSLIRSVDKSVDLKINYGEVGDSIIVENFFSPGDVRAPIDLIKFADGQNWNIDEITERVEHVIDEEANSIWVVKNEDVVYAMGGDDYLNGGVGNDQLYGESGADHLYGDDGDDVLVGGIGNDMLIGGLGNNTFEFSLDHGDDVIFRTDLEATDRVLFDESITESDVNYYRFGDHLVLHTGDENYIIAAEFYGVYPNYTEVNNRFSVEFSEGAIVNSDNVSTQGSYISIEHWSNLDTDYLDRFWTEHGRIQSTTHPDFEFDVEGSENNDIIYGSADNDKIDALKGDDIAYGGAGNDEFRSSTGINTWFGDEGDDTFYGGNQINHYTGGTGDDLFKAAAESHVYLKEGDGDDILDKSWPTLTELQLHLPDSFTEDSFSYEIAQEQDLLVHYGDSGDSINLEGFVTTSSTDITIDESLFISFGDDKHGASQIRQSILDSVNFAPVANDDFGFNVLNTESLTLNYSQLLANDSDLNGDPLSVASVSSPVGGTVVADAVNETIQFTPDANFVGEASFEYQADDGQQVDAANVTIVVSALDSGGGDNNTDPDPSDYDYELTGTENGEQLYYSNSNDYILGLGGDDNIFGLNGNDYLNGGDGNDYIDGGNGDDIQDGGAGNDQVGGDAGNDTLIGGSGDDIYVFRPGSGQDIIDNRVGEDGVDWLIFTDTLTLNQLEFIQNENDMEVNVIDSEDKVTILDWFVENKNRIDYIQPSGQSGISANEIETMLTDGSDGGNGSGDNGSGDNGSGDNWVPPQESDYANVVNGTDSSEQLYHGNGDDYLAGLAGDDQLFGLGGNDYLVGGAGNDYLDGGAGNDIQFGGDNDDQLGGDAGDDLLIGGSGNDIYVFRAGSGFDTINNSVGEAGVDWLIFSDDITDDRLSFTQVGDDLYITIADSTDQVKIEGWFKGAEFKVDYIQPSGGQGIPPSEIESRLTSGDEEASLDACAGQQSTRCSITPIRELFSDVDTTCEFDDRNLDRVVSMICSESAITEKGSASLVSREFDVNSELLIAAN